MLNKEFSNSIIEQTNSLQIKQLEYEQIENSYHFSDELFSLLQDYTTTEKSVNLLYGNKRKKAMKKFDKCQEDIYKIVDGKHTVQELCDKFKLHDKLKKELAEQEQYLYNLENYLLNQSNHILYILHQNGFISQKCGESNDATANTS